MDSKPNIDMKARLQNMLKNLTKCKLDYFNEKEECRQLREIHLKLDIDLKEARELEKSHRYHLQTSREMIGNLQEEISQLIYLKRDIKKLKDEIVSKDTQIATVEKDKDNSQQKHNENIMELQRTHEKHIEEIRAMNNKKLQEMQFDSDNQLAGLNLVIEELREKINETQEEHRNKINIVVLEYEEKIQRSAAEVAQLQEKLTIQTAQTDANINTYRRKIQALEEKIKQNQFKEYLAQSNYPIHSQYDNRVERPYSVNTNYADIHSSDIYSIPESPKPSQSKISKPSTLQVMYRDGNSSVPKCDKKGPFNITKRRKLYTEKGD